MVMLRDHRVKRNIRDMDGLAALDIALRMDHEPLIKAYGEEEVRMTRIRRIIWRMTI